MHDNAAPLERARGAVLDWMRARECDPLPLTGVSTSGSVPSQRKEITDQFLKWARLSGFECQLVETLSQGGLVYETLWTHRGSSFVGFKQPPAQQSAEDALLLGCAALLENEWCHRRLAGKDA